MSSSKKMRIAGWVLSGLVAAFFCFSATGKFLQPPEMAEMLPHLGYTSETVRAIGYVEVALALAFLIPRASFIFALLLTAYLGGAVATHVRIGDPFYFPIVLGIVLWIAYYLRRPDVIKLALSPCEKR